MASIRIERLQALIKRRVSEIIAFELRDPRLRLGSVIEVKLSPDLKEAQIRVSCLGDEADRRTFMRGLASAKGRIRKRVAASLKTRTMPQLRFTYDETIERSIQLSQLIERALAEDREAQRARGELPEGQGMEPDQPPAQTEPEPAPQARESGAAAPPQTPAPSASERDTNA